MAERPSWAGAGKGGKDERMEGRNAQAGERRDEGAKTRRDKDGPSAGKRSHFDDRHRAFVREYYAEQFRGGRCPPGLAKKHNGCQPPGQARKWQLGQPLPREVIFYDVPRPLVTRIGAPPRGYRYVRVATDILLIAIGTGMVVDAIEDLGR
jgi:Ni/Co efflux regulator RcnB